MANIERYSWINAINAGGIQYLHEPRQYIELCSIQPHVLNNSTKLQNISNFQQQTREALQNSQIDEAFEIVKKYVEENKNKLFTEGVAMFSLFLYDIK